MAQVRDKKDMEVCQGAVLGSSMGIIEKSRKSMMNYVHDRQIEIDMRCGVVRISHGQLSHLTHLRPAFRNLSVAETSIRQR